MIRSVLTLIGFLALSSICYGTTVREKSEKLNLISDFSKKEITGDIVVTGKTFHIMAHPSKKKSFNTRGAEITPVITEAPGRKQLYGKDVIGYALGTPIRAYSVASSINWDGNDAYFLDIVTGAPMGTYVKATLQGDELVLPMNQTVLTFEDEDYDINMGLLRPIITIDKSSGDEDVYIWFEYSDDYDSMSYKKDERGGWVLQNMPAKYSTADIDPARYGLPNYVVGYYYTDEYDWSGYCDIYQAYDEFNFEPTVLPDGLPFQKMTYINNEGMGVIVSVYEADNALYLKGLSAYLPDAVVKGDISDDGKRISVAPNQYIGTEENVYYVITTTVKIDNKNDLGNLDKIEVIEDGTPAYFNLERDASTGKILSITSDDSPYCLSFNDDPFYFYPVDIFTDLNLTLQESFAGTPSTPTKAYYEDYSTLMGANYLFFELSSFAANGDIIDINNLYYAVFINGDIVEFEEENGFNLLEEEITMYSGIKQPTTLIPYTFANNIDLYEDNGGTFIVGLYAEGIDTVGVESVYKCDGVTTYSGLVTIDTLTGEESIVDPIETKVEILKYEDVVSTEYYDLRGMKISHPTKGLYVKKYNLKDGSSKTTKVLVK